MSTPVGWTAVVRFAPEEKIGELAGLNVGGAAATTVHTAKGAMTAEPNMNAPRKLNPNPYNSGYTTHGSLLRRNGGLNSSYCLANLRAGMRPHRPDLFAVLAFARTCCRSLRYLALTPS
jgi:hypothetical protein